ncbi:MAG: hypothetical protein CW349_04940 [Firmicutes bacterium]|nr:hypothetical protein [Bacillota bacterium]MBO2519032.1 hypothetical protein [Bacillota bacterium]
MQALPGPAGAGRGSSTPDRGGGRRAFEEVARLSFPGPQGSLARHVKTVEWLKAELVASVAALLRASLEGDGERMAESMATVIIVTAVLARRLGTDFDQLERRVVAQVRANLEEEHQLERWYGDFSALERYLWESRRR